MLFFHVPNHSSTNRMPCVRASSSRSSSVVQSNSPSAGSTTSQYTGATMVLRFSDWNFAQLGARYARCMLELPNSPPRIRKGFPSTMSRVARPRRSSLGSDGVASTGVMVIDSTTPPLDDTEGEHGVGDLDEAGDIRPGHVVS